MKNCHSIILLTLCASSSTLAASDRDPAARIFQETCSVCHGAGVGGAPRLGEAADWAPRITSDIDDLYYNTIDGLGAMPPRGTCMSCTDAELKAVVDYMIRDLKSG